MSNFISKTFSVKIHVLSYMTKLIIAAFVSAQSLINNSMEGVIASMLLSPLGKPIMQLINAMLSHQFYQMLFYVILIIGSISILISIGLVHGYLYRYNYPTQEMEKRSNKFNKNQMLIYACIIGVIIALQSLSNNTTSLEMVGTAIAISILPPIVNSGIYYLNVRDSKNKIKAYNSFLLGCYNIIGMSSSIFMMFMLFREFNPNKFDIH